MSLTQYLQSLARVIEQHPGWRFELVMTNPESAKYFEKAGDSLQEHEIKSRLKEISQLLEKYPESAIVYSWSLVEATLRLVAEKEGLSLT